MWWWFQYSKKKMYYYSYANYLLLNAFFSYGLMEFVATQVVRMPVWHWFQVLINYVNIFNTHIFTLKNKEI